MSRRNGKKQYNQRQVTVHLDDELSLALDSWMINFGLESRAAALLCIARAGLSAAPVDTLIYEIAQQAVRETRAVETESLADYYQSRANLFRSGL